MSKTSPTQRTLALCKKHGWTAHITERWNSFAKIRQDLLGFIDVLALDGKTIVGIQTTSGSNVSARVKKIKDNPKAAELLNCGGRIFVHGWRKSAKTKKWECRELEITKETLKEQT